MARTLLATFLLIALSAVDAFSGCANGVTCGKLTANGFVFDCRFADAKTTNESDTAPAAFMLHGFPEWSDMYMPLMRHLAQHGVRSVACNQRGYSPGARPPNPGDYHYDKLKSDVFALATAARMGRFHLVGHDHGAVLGWVSAASDEGRARLLSYTSLSIPHADAFSAGLFGPHADGKQQVASQYFSMFMMDNSASLEHGFWWETLGKGSGDKYSDHFTNSGDFQRAMWWYNGAFDAGYMSLPPTYSVEQLLWKKGSPSTAALREMFAGSAPAQAHREGIPLSRPIGNMSARLPVLYVCGEKDSAILCGRGYALRTREYVAATTYDYLQVKCGHDVLHKSSLMGDGCSSDGEVGKVQDAVLAKIQQAEKRKE